MIYRALVVFALARGVMWAATRPYVPPRRVGRWEYLATYTINRLEMERLLDELMVIRAP